ncbi:unnamed protein product [Linum trigynum]
MSNVVAIYNDTTIAASEERDGLSLLRRVFGPAPSAGSLQHFLAHIWRCHGSLTILEAPFGLHQFIFSIPSDRKKVKAATPWILDRIMIHLQDWCMPSAEVVKSLLKVPLWLQFWEAPSRCLTSLIACCLGSALGSLLEAGMHIGSKIGGIFLRAWGRLDVSLPFPKSVQASHEDPSKGSFKSKVLYERLPIFCFCCGIIGHTSKRCHLAPEFISKALPYGKWILASEMGSKVDDRSLRCRFARTSWSRADGFPSRSTPLSLPPPEHQSKEEKTRSSLQRLSISPRLDPDPS